MIHANTIQVLDESAIRMTQTKLYKFSHSKSGFSFYDLVLYGESKNEDMQFIQDTLTRQGIPCVIYPDRLTDSVISIKYTSTGELDINTSEYYNLLTYSTDMNRYETSEDRDDKASVAHITNWDNQIKYGNIYTIKQFIK